jgi:uncharacterized protein YutE (UPF0331/DUF86 family)
MNTNTKRTIAHKQLQKNLADLEKAMETLRYSYVKCSTNIVKDRQSPESQESFEALTSRFARSADIMTQKVLKSLFVLIHERPKTFLDTANLLEKLEIIEDVDNIINIRELRNQIAHEYVIDDLHELYSDVLRFIPELERVFGNVKIYIANKLGDIG